MCLQHLLRSLTKCALHDQWMRESCDQHILQYQSTHALCEPFVCLIQLANCHDAVDQRSESHSLHGGRVSILSMSQDPLKQQYIATGGNDALGEHEQGTNCQTYHHASSTAVVADVARQQCCSVPDQSCIQKLA